jgi:hypothetical protein
VSKWLADWPELGFNMFRPQQQLPGPLNFLFAATDFPFGHYQPLDEPGDGSELIDQYRAIKVDGQSPSLLHQPTRHLSVPQGQG